MPVRIPQLLESSNVSKLAGTNAGVRNNLEIYSKTEVDGLVTGVDLTTSVNAISGDLNFLEVTVSNLSTTTNTISGDLDLLEVAVSTLSSDLSATNSLVVSVSGDLQSDLYNLDLSLTQAISDCVHKTGVETISGNKTFVDQVDISHASINHNSNAGNSLATIISTNANGGTYTTYQVMGTNGYGITDWAKATLIESVGASANTGNLVLSSYNGDVIIETGSRTSRMAIRADGAVNITNALKAGYLSVIGTTGAFNIANKFGVDHYNGQARIYSNGPDASTRGGFSFLNVCSDGTSQLESLYIHPNGAMITASTLDVAGTIYAKGGGANIRVYRDGTDTYDWGIFNSGDSLIIRNWGGNTTYGYIRLGSPVVTSSDLSVLGKITSELSSSDANLTLLKNSYASGLCYTSLELSGYYPVGRIITTQNPASYTGGTMTLEVMNTANNAWTSQIILHKDGYVQIPGVLQSGGVRAVSTNNMHIDAGTGTAATYINYYQGTGGVNFCNGAGTINAIISSLGTISTNDDVVLGSGGGYYIGDRLTDGTWRLRRSGNNLIFERRESGSYVTKSTISA